MNTKTFAWFYVGVAGLAFVIGAITGLSGTPTVTTLVPLLFALLTAGGAFYVIKGEGAKDGNARKEESFRRGAFLGKQLLFFAIGFAGGLFLGIWGKLEPGSFWHGVDAHRPAYSDMQFDDMRLLVAVIELDKRMCNSGLEYAPRKQIFDRLGTAINERTKQTGNGLQNIYDSFARWDEPSASNTLNNVRELVDLVTNIEQQTQTNSDLNKTVGLLKQKLTVIENGTAKMCEAYPRDTILQYTDAYQKWNGHPLLSGKDLEIVVELLDGKLKSDELYRYHVGPRDVLAFGTGAESQKTTRE